MNFSRNIKVSGYYTRGFNDETCPPTSMFAAYNPIDSPKTLNLVPETGHSTYPGQNIKLNNWLIEQLKGKE